MVDEDDDKNRSDDDKDRKIEELEDELRRSEANNARQRKQNQQLEFDNREKQKTIDAHEKTYSNGARETIIPDPPKKPDSW